MLHICTTQSASPSSNIYFVDKVLQLQNQLKWWSLFSLIRFHCFVLAGCSEVLHIYGHFYGIIFYFTERLHFLTDRTPSFLSTVHYFRSKQWSEWTNKQYNFFWEETKELVARHLKVSTSRTKTSIITGHKIRMAVIHASMLQSRPSLPQMNTVITILQQNLMKGCAPPPMHLASIRTVPQNCGTWGWGWRMARPSRAICSNGASFHSFQKGRC